MLRVISAQVIAAGTSGGWQTANLADVPMFQSFKRYSAAIVRVYDTVADTNGYLDLYSLPVVTRSSAMTLKAYLEIAVGLIVLTDSPVTRSTTPRVASYYAGAYGYALKGFNNNFHPDTELLPDQKIDLLVYHNDISDYRRLQANALFAVNGLFHKSDYTEDGIVLFDGGRTVTKGNDNRVTVLDFSSLGGVTLLPITNEMIRSTKDTIGLEDSLYIDLPETLEGKTLFVVIGGMLYPLNSSFDMVSSTRVRLTLKHYDLVEWFIDNYTLMDLSALPMTMDVNDPAKFVEGEFHTDAFVRAVLTMSQTFFVVIPTTGITVEKVRLGETDQPGLYRAPNDADPDVPVMIGNGYVVAYNVSYQWGFNALAVPNNQMFNRIWKTTTKEDNLGTNYQLLRDQNETNRPLKRPAAHLLYISKP
ncbi:virion structural protein [Erwinia phage PhiEaH1]|uniref:Virion structural protein n=1 Tax=Erwinia phage PhiEaH1 TaxID=1401669 RepID=W8CZQ0_9CAUD|nr:virion structural protein [Erwinia phage PhiEaH1]AGX01916.1 virion structural protein [Erwinia phage PhiEaH1]